MTRQILTVFGYIALLVALTSCLNNEPNVLPTALFQSTPTSGYAPLVVAFDASASVDPDGQITEYRWEFGDGQTGAGESVTHTYTSEGIYTVVLKVRDNRDGLAESTTDVEVLPQPPAGSVPPVARFTFTPQSPDIGEEVTFTAEQSYDPAGITTKSIISYAWTFGDGSSATGQVVTHPYTASGDYTARLLVTDNDGAQDVERKTVSVRSHTQPPPVARFTFTPQTPNAGEEVAFSASDSYDPAGITLKSIVSYEWDFGDGATGIGKSITHAYTAIGEFVITLVVTDDDGAEGTEQQTIDVVLPAPPPPPG